MTSNHAKELKNRVEDIHLQHHVCDKPILALAGMHVQSFVAGMYGQP